MFRVSSLSKHRVVFNRGDFILYRRLYNTANSIARLNQVLTYETATGAIRVFIRVTLVGATPTRDPITLLPLRKLTDQQTLIGLPVMRGTKLYIVPLIVSGQSNLDFDIGPMSTQLQAGGDLLHVN